MKLDHLGVAVKSLEDALRFYRDLLGLKLEAVEEVPTILADESMGVAITADADGPWTNWGVRYETAS